MTGSIYLHCTGTVHNLRCILDNFRSQVSQCFDLEEIHAQGNAGQGFALKSYRWSIFYTPKVNLLNQQYIEYSEEVLFRDYKYIDEELEKWQVTPVDGPGGASKGNHYDFLEVLVIGGIQRYYDRIV